MAQAPSYDQMMADSSNEDAGDSGKTSFMSKLKDKTKTKGRALKSKFQTPGIATEDTGADTGAAAGDDEDYEDESPVHNEVSGETQPGYNPPEQDQSPSEPAGSVAQSTENFPGNFTGIADDKTEGEKGQEEGLTKSFEGLSTNDQSEPAPEEKPATDKAADSLTSAKDQTKDTLMGGAAAGGAAAGGAAEEHTPSSEDGAPATEQVGQQAQQLGDKTSQATEQAGQQTQQLGDKTSQAGKTWSQWAAEKVGYAKDSAAANAPTTDDGKPVHEAAYGAAADKLGAATDPANIPTTADGKPIHQAAYDTTAENLGNAKDYAAANAPKTADGKPVHEAAYETAAGKASEAQAHIDPANIPSDPAQQTYVQKAAGGFYGAKDSLFSKTEPQEHHKVLSQQVTETVGNLPATIKSSLGFGPKTGASPPTTPASSPNEEAPGAPPKSPGLVSRITGLFSPKKPSTEEATEPTTGAEPTSTS